MYGFSNNPIKLQRAIEKAGKGASEEEVRQAYEQMGGGIANGFERTVTEPSPVPEVVQTVDVSSEKPKKAAKKAVKKVAKK